MQEKERKRVDANREICRAAEALYGSEMYLTDPAVYESRRDAVYPPATQNVQDTREWCLEHQT